LLRPGGVAILNADDPNVRWMATQWSGRVMFVGEAEDAEVRAVDIELEWPHGMRFVALVAGERHEIRTRLVGRHMVFPALAALAVAHLEGVPLEKAIAALADLEPTFGRMAPIALPSGAFVIGDDFKASHESFEMALDTLAELPARTRIAVFGLHTEPHGTDSYRAIGRRAGAVVDRMVVVGSSKDLRAYRAGAAASGLAAQNVDHVRNAHEVVDLLRDQLQPGDVVLVKGRWQQRLARVGLELAGREVQCRVDPCPIKRMVCEMCPLLDQPYTGSLSGQEA
jgi:UDP-N-acetylmuramoyl-tripeptide--D-alanyl-D-alanine ligase